MLEQERKKIEAENSRREFRVNKTLEGLKETERERRQMLMDELERIGAGLYDAQKISGSWRKESLFLRLHSPHNSFRRLLSLRLLPSPQHSIHQRHSPPPQLQIRELGSSARTFRPPEASSSSEEVGRLGGIRQDEFGGE